MRPRLNASIASTTSPRAQASAPSPWAVAAGLLALALIGWAAWNWGTIGGLRWVEFDSPLTLAALGFVAGIGAFFAPCAFALFPGYISYYLASTGCTLPLCVSMVVLPLTSGYSGAALLTFTSFAVAMGPVSPA